jgi:hypothetical protein
MLRDVVHIYDDNTMQNEACGQGSGIGSTANGYRQTLSLVRMKMVTCSAMFTSYDNRLKQGWSLWPRSLSYYSLKPRPRDGNDNNGIAPPPKPSSRKRRGAKGEYVGE